MQRRGDDSDLRVALNLKIPNILINKSPQQVSGTHNFYLINRLLVEQKIARIMLVR